MQFVITSPLKFEFGVANIEPVWVSSGTGVNICVPLDIVWLYVILLSVGNRAVQALYKHRQRSMSCAKDFIWWGVGVKRKFGEMEVIWVTSISQEQCRNLLIGVKLSNQNFSRFSACQVHVLALHTMGKLQLELLTQPSVTQQSLQPLKQPSVTKNFRDMLIEILHDKRIHRVRESLVTILCFEYNS